MWRSGNKNLSIDRTHSDATPITGYDWQRKRGKMFPGNVVLQSAGSLSVAILALIMLTVQVAFLFHKPRFIWYGWSAAISFCGLLYAVGIFFEYNMPPGTVNRIAGLLEFTAIIGLVHCFYGFTFSYLGIKGQRYHIIAGTFHSLVLIFLWFDNSIVADEFVTRNFIGLARPYVEPALGPLGPAFMIYAALACIGAMVVWITHKGHVPRYRALYLAGAGFWLVLGVHDGLAALGVSTVQYMMEYGFFGYSIVVLWTVFNRYVTLSTEDRYRAITEMANDCILVVQSGKTVFANQACNLLIGRPVMDSVTEDLLDYVVPEDRQRLIRYYNESTSLKTAGELLTIRINVSAHKERTVEIRASKMRYRNKPADLFIIRDVTERIREEEALKRSEERLSRLRKMESLGTLAGGVAHDLNNVLSAIISYPDLILMRLPEDSPLRKPIETMKSSGRRAADIVQDLLTVARGVAIPTEPMNMNDIVSGYLSSPEYGKLLHHHPSVTVKAELEPRLLNMRGSPIHIRKTLMNLVSNAAEAIEGLGEVVVSTANRYIDRPLTGYNDANPGEYVVLTVTDNGPGISSDDLQRIFEPFYTKKVMGRSGTGLGLTVVWNVVQDHEGYIDLKSDKEGSKFELYFPAVRESIADKKSSMALEELLGRGEMVLVVDDTEAQREILCSMLEALRYNAEAVSGGEEAVDYLKQHTVDLLLLDMIMDPGIDGLETYKKIRKINSRQKVIIVSGYAETERVKETLKLGAGRYIKKPLILEELGLALREELKK